MSFTKTEMQEELFEFLSQFGKDIADLYGIEDLTWTERRKIEESPIWQAVSEMYDYGILGVPSEDLHPEGHIAGMHGNVERFFRAMDTMPMRFFLEQRRTSVPRLTLLAVQTAVARMVLDDGWRYTDYSTEGTGLGLGNMNHLTIAEVAMLAQMDERSVRNAANPKLPEPLKTTPVGKRSLVTPKDARRWLEGRKGFIPTQSYTGQKPLQVNVTLKGFTADDAKLVQQDADARGISYQLAFQDWLFANLHNLKLDDGAQDK